MVDLATLGSNIAIKIHSRGRVGSERGESAIRERGECDPREGDTERKRSDREREMKGGAGNATFTTI